MGEGRKPWKRERSPGRGEGSLEEDKEALGVGKELLREEGRDVKRTREESQYPLKCFSPWGASKDLVNAKFSRISVPAQPKLPSKFSFRYIENEFQKLQINKYPLRNFWFAFLT
jgi:hypothetical protein